MERLVEEQLIFKDLLLRFFKTLWADVIILVALTLFAGTISYQFRANLAPIIYIGTLSLLTLLYLIWIKPKLFPEMNSWHYLKEAPGALKWHKRAIQARARFFDQTQLEVVMKMGEMSSTIWTDEKYLDALKKMISRGVKVTISCSPYPDIDNREIYKLAIDKKVNLFLVHPKFLYRDKEEHLMVSDHRSVWITGPHTPFAEKKRLMVNYGSTLMAKPSNKIISELGDHGMLVDEHTIRDVEFVVHDDKGQPMPANQKHKENLFDFLGLHAAES